MNVPARVRCCVSLWLLLFVLLSVSARGAAEPTPALSKPVPINMAEAIIEPFWDSDLSGLREMAHRSGGQTRPEYSPELERVVDFEWTSKPEEGPALRMRRDMHVDCSDYDRLVVRLAPPKGSVLRVIALTDKGRRTFVSDPVTKNRAEYALGLDGAQRIETVTLEIEAGSDGAGAGWLRWIGLQNTQRLQDYFTRWDFATTQWETYLQPAGYTPRFAPRYGIFLNADELDALRAEHEQAIATEGASSYNRRVEMARGYAPEKGIHEFVDSGGRTSAHSRVRDEFQPPLPGGPDLAIAGLVLRDADALRMAARSALSLALCEHWETGFMSVLPGSGWDDRAFRRSYTARMSP